MVVGWALGVEMGDGDGGRGKERMDWALCELVGLGGVDM